nr:unnamed protein product [Digitaria exilis]
MQIYCKMEALRNMNLPPGFGFYPSDTELIGHYLKRKILGQKIEHDLIPEVDIYKHEPWDLPAKCNFPIEDNKWHFFASRDRKYPTGSRSNRATVAGYWKSTGKDRPIKQNKRTLGTKKTLVFHEGRPPSGRRTEWIMHEYYIDEKECQVSPDMKDAFVLCRVTKRNDWALENGNGNKVGNDTDVENRNPNPQQPNSAVTSVVVSAVKPEDAAASVICAEDPNQVATPAGSAQLSNDVAMAAITSDTASPNGSNEVDLDALLEEMLDSSPSFNSVPDIGSSVPFVTEQYAESSNPGSVVPKIGPDHASPMKDRTDDYLFFDDIPDDLRSLLFPGSDDFSSCIFGPAGQAEAFATNQTYCLMEESSFARPNNSEDGTPKDELQLEQENNNPNMSNGNSDNGIIIRRRSVTSSTANISPVFGGFKMQVGIKKMVTSNSEYINQTMKFADNSGRCLDSEHQKEHANDATSVKQSGASKLSEAPSQGYPRGMKKAFRCSSVLFAVFVAVAAAVALHYHRSDVSL